MINKLNKLSIEVNFLNMIQGIYENPQLTSCLIVKEWSTSGALSSARRETARPPSVYAPFPADEWLSGVILSITASCALFLTELLCWEIKKKK